MVDARLAFQLWRLMWISIGYLQIKRELAASVAALVRFYSDLVVHHIIGIILLDGDRVGWQLDFSEILGCPELSRRGFAQIGLLLLGQILLLVPN